MKRAAIDIGSNSVLLLIQDFTDGRDEVLLDLSNVTRLGKNIDATGALNSESKAKTYEVLKQYADQIDKYDISREEVVVSATEAARVASDFGDFSIEVKNSLKLEIKVISGEGEAYYSSLGVSSDIKEGEFLVCDLGGASTELIQATAKPFSLDRFVSLPIGSVRTSDWMEQGVLDQKWREVTEKFKSELEQVKAKSMIAVAGTLTSFACYILGLEEFNPAAIDRLSLSTTEFDRAVERLKSESPADLERRFPYLKKRIPTLYSGCLACSKILSVIPVEKINFSTKGLRFGLAKEGKIRNEFVHG